MARGAGGGIGIGSERSKAVSQLFGGEVDSVASAETFGQHMLGQGIDHLRELTRMERERIFNLGYYTWVEQQHISIPDFDARRKKSFWTDLRKLIPAWDEMIESFNGQTGLGLSK